MILAAPTVDDQPASPAVPCARCAQVHARCKAHARKNDNAPCTRWPMKGQLVCMSHGGKAPNAKTQAAVRMAQAAVENTAGVYGVLRRIDPAMALIEEFHRTAGIVAGLEPIVAALTRHELTMGTDSVTETASVPDWGTDAEGDYPVRALQPSERKTVMKAGPSIWVRIFNEERDRLHRLGIDIMKLGLEAQRDAYVREQAGAFGQLLAQLNLTPEQRREAVRLMRGLERVASE